MGAAAWSALLERSGELPSTIYLGGMDESAKREAITLLKERWESDHPGIAPTVHRASEAGVAQVMADAQGGSLFAPVTLVLVLNVEEWARSTKNVAAAAESAAHIPPENGLVFVETGTESERKNLAPLKAACEHYFEIDSLPPDQIAEWGTARLARRDVAADPEVIRTVLESTRLETAEVFNELDKLADWAGDGGRIDARAAEEILRPLHGGRISALAAAIARRQPQEAVDQLLRSLESGEREGNVLFQLQTLYSGALRLKTRRWGWIRDRANSDALARAIGEDQIAEGIDLLYRTERAWKGGRADVRTLLLRAVVGLAEAR